MSVKRLDGRMHPDRLGGPGAAVGDTLVWDGMRWVPGPAGGGSLQIGEFAYDAFSLVSATPALTLTFAPLADSLHLYLNGLHQQEGVDWVRSGQVVTVQAAMGADTGDLIECRYAVATGSSPSSSNTPHTLTFDVRADHNSTVNPNNYAVVQAWWWDGTTETSLGTFQSLDGNPTGLAEWKTFTVDIEPYVTGPTNEVRFRHHSGDDTAHMRRIHVTNASGGLTYGEYPAGYPFTEAMQDGMLGDDTLMEDGSGLPVQYNVQTGTYVSNGTGKAQWILGDLT